jgi:MerR family transcriptional regulator, thiopeptide resistance regulator
MSRRTSTTTARPLTVGQLAELAGITVRTLHHYDETGLLVPSTRSEAGYRLYTTDDVQRLQRVLFYRELGFALEDIATLLDDPTADPTDHLRRQHALLADRIARLKDLQAAVELHLEARTMDIQLTPEEMLDVFGEDYTTNHDAYQAEAQQRWGDTDAWAESSRRAAQYSKDDWARMKAESEDATTRVIHAMQAGLPATSEQAMDGAEAMRSLIGRWFYDCSHAMHCSLADMYVQDPRFRKTYEDMAPGLAQYVHDAIHANADRH